jgi:predicted transcriptional regulator
MVPAMRKPDRIALRLEPGLKPVLEELALADHRTLSSLVEKVLSDFVERQTQLARGGQQQPRSN